MEKNNMLTFAITTATKLAAISLHKEEKKIGEIKIEVLKTHSTTILEQIDKLFKWTGKNLDEVENVIVSIGPGSFTGVRIAVSVVKGLFYGRNVNFYSVNELDALAYQGYFFLKQGKNQNEGHNKENVRTVYSLVDSGKEKIYYSEYRINSGIENEKKSVDFQNQELERIKEYKVAKLDELIEEVLLKNTDNKKACFSGDAVLNYKNKIEDRLKNKIIFSDDDNLKISSSTFVKMLFTGKLKKTDIYALKPDYLEKTQAERDKK